MNKKSLTRTQRASLNKIIAVRTDSTALRMEDRACMRVTFTRDR